MGGTLFSILSPPSYGFFKLSLMLGNATPAQVHPFPLFFLGIFLSGKCTSYIKLRKNGRKIKTFCHPTPDPHTLKKSRMGNWRVLAFARLMPHFEEKGKFLFLLFGPRQIDGKLRTPLPPKEKKIIERKKKKRIGKWYV